MATYKAKNGFILQDATTPGGWTITTAQDIITALLAYPYYETVATCFLWEALEQAAGDRKEYANIDDLAHYIAENYI